MLDIKFSLTTHIHIHYVVLEHSLSLPLCKPRREKVMIAYSVVALALLEFDGVFEHILCLPHRHQYAHLINRNNTSQPQHHLLDRIKVKTLCLT